MKVAKVNDLRKIYSSDTISEMTHKIVTVVVPIHWVGEDGYLVDNQQDISPEDSLLSTNSVNPIANPFTESDSVRDLNFDDAILDEMDSNRFSMVPSSVVYQT
jgi:hypothetical protein